MIFTHKKTGRPHFFITQLLRSRPIVKQSHTGGHEAHPELSFIRKYVFFFN